MEKRQDKIVEKELLKLAFLAARLGPSGGLSLELMKPIPKVCSYAIDSE
jgi:hypothetical protein